MLVKDLKKLILDFKEEENDAKAANNTGFLSGLQFARVNLETLLESHGHNRPSTIDHQDVLFLSQLNK